jgi:hyaluronan synthase
MSLFTPYDLGARNVAGAVSFENAPAKAVPSQPSEFVHASVSRCPHCEIAVHTLGTPAPSVCPYCKRALDQYEETRPLAKAVDPPSKEEVAARIHSLYHKPHWGFATFILGAALALLAWAIFVQLRSVQNYWYQPLVSIYSAMAGLFVITRFLFAAFYHAPYDDESYNPSVTVLVPCFNEGEAIRKTIERIFSTGYPDEQLEVICVNDGSRDDSWKHILEAQTRHPHLVAVNFEHNRGLCHGWGVATALARGEFIVCVDSDTFVFPNSLHKLLQGFRDPTVGGISGHCDVENASTNTLTMMQDVRYYFSYKIMKAAESVFGTVSCLPGCFSAYRRTCVLEVIDSWINATVWGEHGNFADDRSLTNCILRNYKIIYDDTALATTIAPTGWRQYVRQQARWSRSYLREIWKTGKFMWRKHPVPALSWYAMMWMPILEPIVMVQALVIGPVQAGAITPSYIVGVLSITAVWALHFYATTGRRWWWTGFLFTLSYIVFFSWQVYWAFLTLNGKGWGTRGNTPKPAAPQPSAPAPSALNTPVHG